MPPSDSLLNRLAIDEDGFPILLADVPDAGVSQVASGQQSGNPRHDVRSGKFGPGGGGNGNGPRPQQPAAAPQGVEPQEWARRLDQVRLAAREFEQFAPDDIKAWLRGKTNKELSDEEINHFLADVRSQQLDDLVDILDTNIRRSVTRRVVKITAPRGYTKKTMGALSDEEIHGMLDRLKARGWSIDEIDKNFTQKLPASKRANIKQITSTSRDKT